MFVPIATINIFVILMYYFHYPYEVIDGRYDNSNNENNEKTNKNDNQNTFIDSTSQIVINN